LATIRGTLGELELKGFEAFKGFSNPFEMIAGKPVNGARFPETFERRIAK
jgi:hypothetical protein